MLASLLVAVPGTASAATGYDAWIFCLSNRVWVSTPMPYTRDDHRDWAAVELFYEVGGKWYQHTARQPRVYNRDVYHAPPPNTVVIGGEQDGYMKWNDKGTTARREWWYFGLASKRWAKAKVWFYDGRDQRWTWKWARVPGTYGHTQCRTG